MRAYLSAALLLAAPAACGGEDGATPGAYDPNKPCGNTSDYQKIGVTGAQNATASCLADDACYAFLVPGDPMNLNACLSTCLREQQGVSGTCSTCLGEAAERMLEICSSSCGFAGEDPSCYDGCRPATWAVLSDDCL